LTHPESRPLRERTREELLEVIRTRGETTRAELTELTGLTRSTINATVSKLFAEGRVVQTTAEVKGPGSGRGRPGAHLRAVVRDTAVVGIDFGHTHVQVGLGDSLGRRVDSRKQLVDVDLDAGGAMDVAARMVSELTSAHGVDVLSGVVAGVPGPVDIGSGLVCSPTILSGWVGLVPARELTDRLGCPVHVENDAILGAIGVAVSEPDLANFLYVKASHGIGAGVVINGQPYRGVTGLAGEIGHTNLAGYTQLCRCGNRGCLEAVISAGSLLEQIAHTRPGKESRDLDLDAFDDPIAKRVLTNAGRLLGTVLADHVNLLNPRAVVVGGELGRADGAFICGIREAIDPPPQPQYRSTPPPAIRSQNCPGR
jgi:predicted NBD/HSP70 family sugar kinase